MHKLLVIGAVVAAPVLFASSGAFAWGCGYGYAPRYAYGYSAPRYYGYSYAPRYRFYGARVFGWRGWGHRRWGWGRRW